MVGVKEKACCLKRSVGHRGVCVWPESEADGVVLCKNCKHSHPYAMMNRLVRLQGQFEDNWYQASVEKINAGWRPHTEKVINSEDLKDPDVYICASRQIRYRDAKNKAKEFVPKMVAARRLEITDENKRKVVENHLDEDDFECSRVDNWDAVCRECQGAVVLSEDQGLKDLFEGDYQHLKGDVADDKVDPKKK